MKRWWFNINLLCCFLVFSDCSQKSSGVTKPKTTQSQESGTGAKPQGGTTVKPSGGNGTNQDTVIRVTPPTVIKHGSNIEELLDSLKRANAHKKKGG